jgi:hypothetical protein
MKRIVAGMTLVALAGMLVAAPPAFAGGRRHYHGHRGHHHHRGSGAGYLVGGLALGALTGVVVGSLLAPKPVYADPPVVYQPAPPPAPVVVQPAPVVVAPPAPVCTDYYVPSTYRNGVWVGAHWERICQ